MDWARICIDVDDRRNVIGYSVEVHVKDQLEAVYVFPCGPFDAPWDTLNLAIEWLFERYGEQLELSLF
jgi:hypothetical protein